MAMPDQQPPPDDTTYDDLNDLMNLLGRAAEDLEEVAEHVESRQYRGLLEAFAGQLMDFGGEIGNVVVSMGGEVDVDRDFGDDLREFWIELKAAIGGDNAQTMLDHAEALADKIVEAYRDVLGGDLTMEGRQTIANQYNEIEKMHASIRDMRDASAR